MSNVHSAMSSSSRRESLRAVPHSSSDAPTTSVDAVAVADDESDESDETEHRRREQ